MGRDLTNNVAQLSIKVNSQTSVALRSNSNQRTAGYAEAKKKREKYEQVERQVLKGVAARWQETATTETPGTCGAKFLGEGGQAKVRT
eukprot:179867-Pleurochrysis_carterae.AAC.1